MQFKLTVLASSLLIALHANGDIQDNQHDVIPVVLAHSYHQGINVAEYWQSEKLDGIRAVWDGKQLKTRNGRHIHVPKWFSADLPEYPVEGELWAGRGNFHVVQQTVLDHNPVDEAWRKIRFMLFDLPHAAGDYSKRYYNLIYLVEQIQQAHIQYIEHSVIQSEQELFGYLDSVDNSNGEGIMLRRISSHYQAGRSSDLLKLKHHQDDEAVVIGYKVGTGKYKGMLGAVLVEWRGGKQFYIGSGFTDQQRKQPPLIGATITFRHNGFTSRDLPKFARYVRTRVE
ncbi:DNA ligase [Vibrio sp. 404]|uniref:DNA ligase n=1 Tax=Vibrio marinisediminis TaxID=2758441 RepID=A0A7W2FSM1_9VIBR|nr:DNA ligase [Vibrio marinisediminis]MBA5763533.1 DNA ligase [Vibrio marinisediminis]